MATKRKRRKKEYSKVVTGLCIAIVIAFIFFVCVEAHKQQDLSVMSSVSDIVQWIAVAAIGGYFYKARAENQIKLQLQYQKEASELHKKYGDDYVTETLDFDNFK